MNISLANVKSIDFNNSEIAKVYFNSTKVWEKPVAQGIYGVSWDKTNTSPILTRTDDAASFSNPVVSVGGAAGSSPFDNIMPWSGMVKEVLPEGGVMVKIPKFWYKIVNASNAMTIRIANYAADGFNVSPAHMDRGDGRGERDYVYVGRYKCSEKDMTSKSGENVKVNDTLLGYRTLCSNIGTNYHLEDYTMYWTIRLLYLVEFATWDSQSVICLGYNYPGPTGSSDTMTYHTGTIETSIGTGTLGYQYRWIEGLWSALETIDGVICLTNQVKIAYDFNYNQLGTGYPRTYSRATSYGEIKDFNGSDWALFPSTVVSNTQFNTYVCDNYGYNSKTSVGRLDAGSGSLSGYNGLFALSTAIKAADGKGEAYSCRLMYIP